MKKITIFLMLLALNTSFAESSMRKCMLLPITDSNQGKLAFSVFELLEEYLKGSDWCYYRSNSEIINILGNYKKNISTHLKNKEVIKLIAEKSGAGSMIRIEIINQLKGADLIVEVVGSNGTDIYFKEKTELETAEPEFIAQTVENWLKVYEKNIPYDGRLIGVLGNQFTIDVGRGYGIRVGDTIKIVRPIRKKRHPLLKEVVDWETKTLARGKIYNITNTQAQGKIEEYNSRSKMKLEDWAIVGGGKTLAQKISVTDEDAEKYKFGKLGNIGLFFDLGTGSESLAESDGTENQAGGILVGVQTKLEMWITRKYWGSIEVGKKFGNYSKKKGNIASDTNVIDTLTYKMKAGYKYLPLGFFYGPQIDGYVGYASYNYGLDTDSASGLTDTTFSGILVGMRADVPVYNQYRLFVKIDVLPYASYSEEIKLHGGEQSSLGYDFELGGTYSMSPTLSLYGSINVSSNKAKFESGASHGIRSITFKENNLRFGTQFTF